MLNITDIYNRYHAPLMRYGLSLCSDEEQVRDIVQDVFLAFLARIDRHVLVANVQAYLYTSMRNHVYDMYRTQARQRTDALAPALAATVIDDTPNAYDAIASQENATQQTQALQTAVDTLPARSKQIIDLIYNEQADYQQVCHTMNIGYQPARNLMSRTLKRLRQAM